MIFDSDTLKWIISLYILIMSGVGFYLIYLGSRSNFINDNAWVSKKGLDNISERDPLRELRNSSYNFSIALVVINFFIITTLIFTKYKIILRA